MGIYNANILEEEEKEKKKRAAKATVTEPCQTIVTHVPPQNISRSTRWCLNTCIFCTSNETFFLCPFMIHEDGSVLKNFFFSMTVKQLLLELFLNALMINAMPKFAEVNNVNNLYRHANRFSINEYLVVC